jgi:hypothetical protein
MVYPMSSLGRALLCLLLATGLARADFLSDVRPTLKSRCFSCHGALKAEAGLRLDSVALMQKGGESGPLLADSGRLLIERISAPASDPDRMPPEGAPLSPSQIDAVRSWLAAGAPAPSHDEPEPDPRSHWAFQPPVLATPPPAANADWNLSLLDRALAARHAAAAISPQNPAPPSLWLRRVAFDLTGLPPSSTLSASFLADPSPEARANAVDQLLASPQFGERWARHCMDLWRYSDWWGLDAQLRYSQKHIWHWRDWIVESLNADSGFDRMITDMLAADEASPDNRSALRATGFLCRPYYLFNRTTWLDEVVEHTSRAFLGLTMQCVKCHDHKYDPLSHSDYYRLRAVFEPYHVRVDQWPTEPDFEKNGLARAFDLHPDKPTHLHRRGDEKQADTSKVITPDIPAIFGHLSIQPVPLPTTSSHPGLLPHVLDHLLATATSEATTLAADPAKPERAAAAALRPDVLKAVSLAEIARANADPRADSLASEAARLEAAWKLASATADAAEAKHALASAPPDKQGDLAAKAKAATEALAAAKTKADSPGNQFSPLIGAIKALEGPDDSFDRNPASYPTTSTGRRLALARWITGPQNPLTARVLVNHVWLRTFGSSLVPDPSDFGRRTPPPLHQNILDSLAVSFQQSGWKLKPLLRSLVLSRAYLSSSSASNCDAALAKDPDNSLLWRMNPKRLESQAIRDGVLALSGSLDLSLGGPSIPVPQQESSNRRALYLQQHGELEDRFLGAFDNASVFECYRRRESVTPQQALALTNSRLARTAAESMAASLASLPDDTFITSAFSAILSRQPSPDESQVCLKGLADFAAANPPAARSLLILALFNHNDFVTLR